MIQQGVSTEGIEHVQSHNDSSGPSSLSGVQGQGMTIGKVMDWIEARMEAIKSREEEEDEEEEKERERERGASSNPSVAGAATAPPSKLVPPSKAPNHTRPVME